MIATPSELQCSEQTIMHKRQHLACCNGLPYLLHGWRHCHACHGLPCFATWGAAASASASASVQASAPHQPAYPYMPTLSREPMTRETSRQPCRSARRSHLSDVPRSALVPSPSKYSSPSTWAACLGRGQRKEVMSAVAAAGTSIRRNGWKQTHRAAEPAISQAPCWHKPSSDL